LVVPTAEHTANRSEGQDRAAPSGERRVVTALFYDRVGSTVDVATRDPEEVAEVERRFHRACIDEVRRYGGFVDRFDGDAGVAYFGFPAAQEDAALRAVQAGLGIVAASDRAGTRVRVGVATGLIVVHREAEAGFGSQPRFTGVAPNLAQRLQGVAAENSVLVADSTRELTARAIEYEFVGQFDLRGFDAPQPGWRALRLARLDDVINPLRASMAPFVAREREMQTIGERWRTAAEGRGQVVLLAGEPGLGKSRLVAEIKQQLSSEDHFRFTYQASPQGSATPFYPIIRHIESTLESVPGGAGSGLDRLETLLARSTDRVAEIAPIIGDLLGLPYETRYRRLDPDPERIKQQTFDVLLDQLRNLTDRKPVLLIFEDVHWSDPSTLELIDRIAAALAVQRALMIVSFRSGYAPSWATQPHVTALSLARLPRPEAEQIIDHIAGERGLPARLRERIVHQTDGVPLFIEHMTKFVLDNLPSTGNGAAEQLPDPSERHGVIVGLADFLAARLEPLGERKIIAQVASAIGRTFSASLLKRVAERAAADIDAALARMVELGLADSRATPADMEYGFRHALVQEAAYRSLLLRDRAAIHRRIVAALQAHYGGTSEATPEILAFHFEKAGMTTEAVGQLQAAARTAAERSANKEVVQLLTRAAGLLESLPEGAARDALALDNIVILGPALMNLHGSGSSEVRRLYERGLELCERLPHSRAHFTVLWGWWFIAPNFKVMRERADRLLALTRTIADPELELQAHHCQWATLFNLGKHAACLRHIKAGLALYEKGDYRSHRFLYGGHDPKACALGERSLSLWLQGCPEQAMEACRQMIAHATSLRHRGTLSHARDIEIMLNRYCGNAPRVLDLASQLIEFADENDFPDVRAKGRIFHGWALARLGDTSAGVGLITDGLSTLRGIGTQEDFPVYYEMLAEAGGGTARLDDGRLALDASITMAKETALRYWLAEAYRRKGLMLAAQDPADAAALDCLHTAVDIATQQGARTLLLRALTSLAGIDSDRHDRAPVLARLREVMADFTEGFDTPDQVAARRLLAA
jgi:predicted ATPase/class 3 adenylate cyclase